MTEYRQMETYTERPSGRRDTQRPRIKRKEAIRRIHEVVMTMTKGKEGCILGSSIIYVMYVCVMCTLQNVISVIKLRNMR
jgi:hypothetical protein